MFLNILICIAPVIAQENAQETVNKINLEQALELGLKNNMDIQAKRMDIPIAKNNIKKANRLQNPDFMTFYNIGPAGHGNPQQLGAVQFVEVGKRGARKKLAKSNLALTEKDVGFAEFNLKMYIRGAYIDFVAAKSILNELEEQKKLLEGLHRIASKRVEVGAAPGMEEIQAQIALNHIVTQINKARADVEIAKYQFNKALNIKDGDTVYEANDDELPFGQDFVNLKTPKLNEKLPAFSEISDIALSKRFDIKIAKQEIDMAEKNLKVVMSQRIPDLVLLGGYQYQPQGYSDTGGFKGGGYLGGGITNIPLLYNYSPEVKNAKVQVDQAKLNYDSVENKALKDLKGTYEKFIIAQENLNYYDENLLEKSRELMQILRRSYEVGKSNLTSLIVIQQSYKAIFIDYVNALADYYACWIEFLQEVNDEDITLHAKAAK